ncbi:MAG: S9 family peptidase [Gemmatimonadetes bacterium]|nr:S9 family peptidase [Gemmatimonadota bacterium]
MRRRLVRTVTLSLTVFAVAPIGAQQRPAGPTDSAQAQARRRMTFIDLLNVARLSGPELSPDGRQLVYILAEADWKANRRISHIWRIGTDGAGVVRLTNGVGEQGARWSPDGTGIAFYGRRANGDEAQVYVIPNNGGEARAVTHQATSVSRIAWSPDGKSIYFTAPDPKSADARDDVVAVDETYQQTHIWRVAVATGAETRITSGAFTVRDYQLSQDGRKIAYHRAPSPLPDDLGQGEVWVMDADGSHAVQLTKRDDYLQGGASLSPDNSTLMFLATTSERFEPYYNRKIFLMPAAGGAPRIVSPADMPYEVLRAVWSKDGKSIYFVANMGVHAELFVMPATGGTPKQLTDGPHNVGGFTGLEAGLSIAADRIAFIVDQPTNAGDVWMLAPGSPTPRQVTHVFDYLAKEFDLPRQERLEWKGADGVTVEGILIYPVGYQPGQKYPLVVQPHGGPTHSDKFGFGREYYGPQMLAARGYAVLHPNYRGSTGYGDPFLRDMVGHYFQNSHLDVMAGTDEVIRRGIADPDRMVLSGWSAGGHMTNKIITVTHRFKAAASGAGVANWVSMYAQSASRSDRTIWFGGTPWQKNAPLDIYWANSPLKDVSNVQTPTLFFVGEQDFGVPVQQSLEMYRALRSNGIPTHLYVAPRDGHIWEELRHQLFKMNVEFEWFEKHATQRPFSWEKAPGEEGQVRSTSQQ